MTGVPTPEPVEFRTSGTTGTPVRWLRTGAQVAAEVDLLVAVCDARDIDGVVCYAPATHLYGYLMGRAVPDRLGVAARSTGLTDPPGEAFTGLRRPLVAALPASLSHLARSAAVVETLDHLVIVHSTAALPPDAARLVAALGDKIRFVELFGATETGLIASRTGVDATDWMLAPDVTIKAPVRDAGAPVPLVVSGPRLARSPDLPPMSEWPTGDLVRLTGPRSFRWDGRAADLVKVGGRRIDVAALLAEIARAVPGVALSVRPEPDAVRGEWFTVLVHTDDPRAVEAVRARCRALPAWQRPRAVEAERPGDSHDPR